MEKGVWSLQSTMPNIPITNHNKRVQVLPSTHLQEADRSAFHIHFSSSNVPASAAAEQLRQTRAGANLLGRASGVAAGKADKKRR